MEAILKMVPSLDPKLTKREEFVVWFGPPKYPDRKVSKFKN